MFRKLINKLVARYILREYKRHLLGDMYDYLQTLEKDTSISTIFNIRNSVVISNSLAEVKDEELNFNGEFDYGDGDAPLIIYILDEWLEDKEHALS